MLTFKAIRELREHLIQTFPAGNPPADWIINPELCPDNMNGDITVNCFRFAKIFRQAPDKIAAAVTSFLKEHPDVSEVEQIKAFVNVTIKHCAIYRDSVAKIDELLESAKFAPEDRRKVVVEYSAPNTNKPLHLGHVRNNTLGQALVSLLSRVGHETIPVNLINDRGVHICKSMIAYQRFGDDVTPESSGIKGDHLVGDFYVRYNDELNRQLSELRAAKPELTGNDDELFLETEIGQATQKMLRDWEDENCEVRDLWRKMNDWVITGFEETYDRMGIKFDQIYLESDTYLLGKDIVASGLEKGVFQTRADGATTVDLGKMGEKVVLRSDGTSVYITQDLGTTLMKQEEFSPDQQIWVVGDEQILHFKMLFTILKKLGFEWADKCHHLAYGMVKLPSGKMKSREGTVVDADDLFDEMESLAKTATLERCGDNAPPDDLDSRSTLIGMGALKFMLLKFNPKTEMLFDPEASVKFEGDTGPYVQYACARINSILRKGTERGITLDNNTVDWSLLDSPEEKALALQAFYYPKILGLAADKMDCSALINYLLDLAKAFSRFYRECTVLNAESEDLCQARLALCLAARNILHDGLKTLTIEVPTEM